jgi:palmitoyltransferase ZDHHC3/7/25
MSALVWVLMLYSAVTVTLLTITEGIPVICGMTYDTLCFMALACHAKTSVTDPGSVPIAAIPSERQRLLKDSHSMCGQCQTFKPPMSHHCRICNRCISRMDHHCPWVCFTSELVCMLSMASFLIMYHHHLHPSCCLFSYFFLQK